MNMKYVHMVAFILVIVGALNWLALAVLGWDVGGLLLGGMDSVLAKAVYVLVGLSGLYLIFTHKSDCRVCSSPAGAM